MQYCVAGQRGDRCGESNRITDIFLQLLEGCALGDDTHGSHSAVRAFAAAKARLSYAHE
jgi:hypothetical protein